MSDLAADTPAPQTSEPLAILRAELFKLWRLKTAWVGVAFAAVLGFLPPLVVFFIQRLLTRAAESDPQVAQQLGAVIAADPVWTALWLRNLVLPLLLIILVALVFANEYQGRTLREDLLRPISRTLLLSSKWVALLSWTVVTVGVTTLFAALPSLLLFGTSGAWLGVMGGAILSIPAEAGILSLVLLIAVLTRSAIGTVGGAILAYLFERAIALGLWLASQLPDAMTLPGAQAIAEGLRPWLPSAAFAIWRGPNPDIAWSIPALASLTLLIVLGFVLADRVFRRMDVP